jgi:hypothetical protein
MIDHHFLSSFWLRLFSTAHVGFTSRQTTDAVYLGAFGRCGTADQAARE